VNSYLKSLPDDKFSCTQYNSPTKFGKSPKVKSMKDYFGKRGKSVNVSNKLQIFNAYRHVPPRIP
jgi:hypothetical protein